MDGQSVLVEFDEGGVMQRGDDPVEMDFKQRDKPWIGDVAGRDKEETGGLAGKNMRIQKIGVLADHHRFMEVCQFDNGTVRSAVSRVEIEGVSGVLPKLVEPDGQQTWQLGIDQEIHAAGRGSKRLIRVKRAA